MLESVYVRTLRRTASNDIGCFWNDRCLESFTPLV